MAARALMFQGTGSDVGKSLIVAGLARALADRGLKVRPFKPQNMSNNAAVTVDGGEIGRAQALQARAARAPLSVHMNPVLLKPQSETGAQIVVQGRVHGAAKAQAYQAMKPALMPFVLESFARLKDEADIVLVEGAGSASEVNLRANDIANMGFARAADVPVVIIGDIDRGGVIASLVGTKAVIAPDDAALVRGFLVNKFRGDPGLVRLRNGRDRAGDRMAAARPHPVLRRCPAVAGRRRARARCGDAGESPKAESGSRYRSCRTSPISTTSIRWRRNLRSISSGCGPARRCPAMPTPSSSPARRPRSRTWRHSAQAGFDIDLLAHRRRGGTIIGLCGGYQMLGRIIADPAGIEGPAGTASGLGLLDVETTLSGAKRLVPAGGEALGAPFSGYEMHMGITSGPDCERPFARLADGSQDGAMSADGRVIGTYVHGLFGDDRQRSAWLVRWGAGPSRLSHDALVEATLDRLAAHLAAHVDIDRLLSLAR